MTAIASTRGDGRAGRGVPVPPPVRPTVPAAQVGVVLAGVVWWATVAVSIGGGGVGGAVRGVAAGSVAAVAVLAVVVGTAVPVSQRRRDVVDPPHSRLPHRIRRPRPCRGHRRHPRPEVGCRPDRATVHPGSAGPIHGAT